MSRSTISINALLPVALLFAATAGNANTLRPAATPAGTPTEVASKSAADAVAKTTLNTDSRTLLQVATTGSEVVFRNLLDSSTRIVLADKDGSAFTCLADGDSAIRSRSGQYLLRGGAELVCTVRPGTYRYTTLTSERGSVRKARSTLRVQQ